MSKSSVTDTTSSGDFDESVCYFGRVKWFNNKAGYGFCTVVGDEGGDRVGEDIFVHHTGVKVGSEQYKYLVQGEYVHFNLRSSDSQTHPYQAADLTGLWGGKLMCETRNEQRQQRADREDGEGEQGNSQSQSSQSQQQSRGSRQRTVRLHGAGPREGETWTLTRDDKRNNKRRPRQDDQE